MQVPALSLYDPRNGDLALAIEPIGQPAAQPVPQRSNCFSILWVHEGTGDFHAGLGRFSFSPDSLLCLTPYQAFRLSPAGAFRATAIRFHANFLCIETHHHEVGCNGVLFNDIYGAPLVQLDEHAAAELAGLVASMQSELRGGGLAQSELLLSYLKIFLVRATRCKIQQTQADQPASARRPEILVQLQEKIEANFHREHTPAAYAAMLHTSPKTLGRLVRQHMARTLTDLIRERILKDAKWQLLHTRKPVKEIAGALGFADVFYFSRLFKQAAGCSPTFFREFETEIRGGSNLSIE
ncbi:MAG TPA: AraC family transcriptional regulator [Bryobacteraceae bacterium]|nr:AraC family transcriptional regulator [Bryobacteraceae bacterium]